jgi:hypothetical protein
LAAQTDAGVDELVARAGRAGAEIVTEPDRQPWGCAGAFADPDGHLWMVTSQPFPHLSSQRRRWRCEAHSTRHRLRITPVGA